VCCLLRTLYSLPGILCGSKGVRKELAAFAILTWLLAERAHLFAVPTLCCLLCVFDLMAAVGLTGKEKCSHSLPSRCQDQAKVVASRWLRRSFGQDECKVGCHGYGGCEQPYVTRISVCGVSQGSAKSLIDPTAYVLFARNASRIRDVNQRSRRYPWPLAYRFGFWLCLAVGWYDFYMLTLCKPLVLYVDADRFVTQHVARGRKRTFLKNKA